MIRRTRRPGVKTPLKRRVRGPRVPTFPESVDFKSVKKDVTTALSSSPKPPPSSPPKTARPSFRNGGAPFVQYPHMKLPTAQIAQGLVELQRQIMKLKSSEMQDFGFIPLKEVETMFKEHLGEQGEQEYNWFKDNHYSEVVVGKVGVKEIQKYVENIANPTVFIPNLPKSSFHQRLGAELGEMLQKTKGATSTASMEQLSTTENIDVKNLTRTLPLPKSDTVDLNATCKQGQILIPKLRLSELDRESKDHLMNDENSPHKPTSRFFGFRGLSSSRNGIQQSTPRTMTPTEATVISKRSQKPSMEKYTLTRATMHKMKDHASDILGSFPKGSDVTEDVELENVLFKHGVQVPESEMEAIKEATRTDTINGARISLKKLKTLLSEPMEAEPRVSQSSARHILKIRSKLNSILPKGCSAEAFIGAIKSAGLEIEEEDEVALRYRGDPKRSGTFDKDRVLNEMEDDIQFGGNRVAIQLRSARPVQNEPTTARPALTAPSSDKEIQSLVQRILRDLNPNSQRDAFRDIDDTKTGHITARELREGLAKHRIVMSVQEAEHLVDRYDKDRDGYISFAEWCTMFVNEERAQNRCLEDRYLRSDVESYRYSLTLAAEEADKKRFRRNVRAFKHQESMVDTLKRGTSILLAPKTRFGKTDFPDTGHVTIPQAESAMYLSEKERFAAGGRKDETGWQVVEKVALARGNRFFDNEHRAVHVREAETAAETARKEKRLQRLQISRRDYQNLLEKRRMHEMVSEDQDASPWHQDPAHPLYKNINWFAFPEKSP